MCTQVRPIHYAIFLVFVAYWSSAQRIKPRLNIGLICPEGQEDPQCDILRKEDTHTLLGIPKYKLKVKLQEIRDNFSLNLYDLEQANETLTKLRLSVIVGPYNEALKIVAERNDVMYISTTLSDEWVAPVTSRYIYWMLPSHDIVHEAVVHLTREYEWLSDVAVVYDSPQGLQLIDKLMAENGLTVRGWRLHEGQEDQVLIQHLLDIRQRMVRQIIINCDAELFDNVLRVALKLSMLSPLYTWVVVTLEARFISYTPYAYTQVNYTTFQLLEEKSVAKPSEDMLDRAIARDALKVVGGAAVDVLAENEACDQKDNCRKFIRVKGGELNAALAKTSLMGKTGYIAFNELGQRDNITLQLVSLHMKGLRAVGSWQQKVASGQRSQLKMTYPATFNATVMHPPRPSVLKIVTLVEEPFVMRHPKFAEKTGNDRYQGYLIDLMTKIAKKMNFQYELYESPDGNYGSRDEKGEWNGMIKELIIGNASMCLGAISITSEREKAVDFSKPFKQKTFSIIMKKPKVKKSIVQFLWPIAPEVWFLTIASLIVIGMLLHVFDRFSPSGGETAPRIGIQESLWFIYGSLVGAGGSDLVPRTVSGRLLSGAWWFFSLIFISSYTANLAAFLTVTKIETPIKSVDDLAAQTKIRYGTVRNTYANSFFRSSNIDTFKKMWAAMHTLHPDSLVDNSSVAYEKVKKGDYAFIWDSPINEYYTQQEPCDTMIVGDTFDEKGYGIGVPLGDPNRDKLTQAILQLSEKGTLVTLQEKWWSGGVCGAFSDTTSSTKELNLHTMAGLFVCLLVGSVLGAIACFIEWIYIKARRRKKGKQSQTTPEKNDSLIRDVHYFENNTPNNKNARVESCL